MKIFFAFVFLLILSGCAKQPVHPPVGGILSEKDMQQSQNRIKNLNQMERSQIEEWIGNQEQKFYAMPLNYWADIPNLQNRNPKKEGEMVSYEYLIYDFAGTKVYDQPIERKNVLLGKFEELKAVENIVKYLEKNEHATLLVPSTLAYGTYGDNDKITNDVPLIIKITNH
ncbi:MAG: FKBP-type peptidyl-prolyl cis-trans isomerase [Cruoricaptor ignavus]|nr:FKBP-type peptidyl-prolyl cis-trans isomerase [Cruoricaptor ignavus]